MVDKPHHPTHWAARLRKAATGLRSVRGRPRRVVVSGASMRPAFDPGDRLVVVPVSTLAAGQVVAVRDPREPARLLVKRIHALTDAGLDVRGDDPGASTDSRHFGPVRAASVIGRAVYRYHPPERAGWIDG